MRNLTTLSLMLVIVFSSTSYGQKSTISGQEVSSEGTLNHLGKREGKWKIKYSNNYFRTITYSNGLKNGFFEEVNPDGYITQGTLRTRLLSGGKPIEIPVGIWTRKPPNSKFWKVRDNQKTHRLCVPWQTTLEEHYNFHGQLIKYRFSCVGGYYGEGQSHSAYLDEQGTLNGEWAYNWYDFRKEYGSLKKSVKHGTWEINWLLDGTTERGRYVNGQRHGNWTISRGDGTREVGKYYKGNRTGKWIIQYRDGHFEEGLYKDGKREGYWRVIWPDGVEVRGPMNEGVRVKKWQIEYPSGLVREAEFTKEKRSYSVGTVTYNFPKIRFRHLRGEKFTIFSDRRRLPSIGYWISSSDVGPVYFEDWSMIKIGRDLAYSSPRFLSLDPFYVSKKIGKWKNTIGKFNDELSKRTLTISFISKKDIESRFFATYGNGGMEMGVLVLPPGPGFEYFEFFGGKVKHGNWLERHGWMYDKAAFFQKRDLERMRSRGVYTEAGVWDLVRFYNIFDKGAWLFEKRSYYYGVLDGGYESRRLDGTVVRGQFDMGQKSGLWFFRGVNGAVSYVYYTLGIPNGSAILHYSNGAEAYGAYKAGERTGEWIIRYSNGMVVKKRYINLPDILRRFEEK